MAYLTHKSYHEIERLYKEGRISREVADEAHKQHKIISEAVDEHSAAESKMIEAIRILNNMEVKEELGKV